MKQFNIARMYGGIPLSSRLKFIILFLASTLLIVLAVQPIKNYAWRSVKSAGDDALAAQNYDYARLQYAKLHLIRMQSQEPNALIDRANAGEKNILSLRQFYEARNDLAVIAQFDAATKAYTNPIEATLACQELLKSSWGQLALHCITNTTSTWPTYRDAWITSALIAKQLDDDASYQTARQKALELDPALTLP